MSATVPAVSVVIPTYNRARMLPSAIDSILRQEHARLEIIVVDDGSSDDTRSVVAQYGPQLRYVWQENAGCGAARNLGMALATGDFIAFLDSDDRWCDSKLSMQLALFDAHSDVGLVFSDFVIAKPSGETLLGGASRWAGRRLDFPEMAAIELSSPSGATGWPTPTVRGFVGPMYRQLLDELPILTSSVMVRRSVLDATTRYAAHVRLFEDWEFFAHVARRAAVGFLDIATTVNVGHPDPTRVSHCSALARAQCYVSLLQRVWLADAAFCERHRATTDRAYSRALLAVARQALLANDLAEARQALGEWRSLIRSEGRGWAALYKLCIGLPGGGVLLRSLLRAQAAGRFLTRPRNDHGHSVNPAT